MDNPNAMQNNSTGMFATSVPVGVVPERAEVALLEYPHQRAERGSQR